MEYNHPSDLIKELNFGQDAKSKIIAGTFIGRLGEPRKIWDNIPL